MKHLVLPLLIPLAAGCTATAADVQAADTRAVRAQTELAEAIRGRVAGPPVACVNLRDLRGNRSAGEQAIIFDGPSRRTIYVNRPPAGCPDLNFNRTLTTRTTSTRLCRGDIATVVDLTSGAFYGSCGLGDFTPYRLASR